MSKGIKVVDYVKFLGSSYDSTWKAEHGLNVGDIVPVLNLDDDMVLVRTKTNAYIWVFLSQVAKCVPESETYNPLITQEGGGHYKDKGIQPLEYTMQNNLSFCEGNVVKYISRYKSKNGVEDLAKVIHYALLASYEEYGEDGSIELRNKVLKLLGVSE